jgi:hypothetical protein
MAEELPIEDFDENYRGEYKRPKPKKKRRASKKATEPKEPSHFKEDFLVAAGQAKELAVDVGAAIGRNAGPAARWTGRNIVKPFCKYGLIALGYVGIALLWVGENVVLPFLGKALSLTGRGIRAGWDASPRKLKAAFIGAAGLYALNSGPGRWAARETLGKAGSEMAEAIDKFHLPTFPFQGFDRHPDIDPGEVPAATVMDRFNFWINKRQYTPEQAVGPIVNEWAESRYNPKTVGDKDLKNWAYGGFQWRSPRPENILANTGIDVRSPLTPTGEHLKAAAWEMQHMGAFDDNYFRTITSAPEAARYFCKKFERPAKYRKDGQETCEYRAGMADKFLKIFHDSVGKGFPSSSSPNQVADSQRIQTM